MRSAAALTATVLLLLGACASEPSDVVASGSSTTGSAASEQPVVTSEAVPPDVSASAQPATGCATGEELVVERPDAGWLEQGRPIETQHPIGTDGGSTMPDVANGTDLDEQIRASRESVFAWADALFEEVVRGQADVRVRCLSERSFAVYTDIFFVLGNPDGQTLEVQIIDRLTGGFPYFTTPLGELSFAVSGGYDVMMNDYDESRQEAWVISADGVALMLRAKGADAANLAGWPTTFAPPLDAPEPQPAPATAKDLTVAALELHGLLFPS